MYPSGQNTRSSLLEWSVSILGAAAAVFLASQVHLNVLDKERLQADYEEARKNVAVLAGSAKQAEEAFQKREIYLQNILVNINYLEKYLILELIYVIKIMINYQ